MSNGPERKRPRLFRLPTSRQRLRGDIDRELRFHIEGRVEELIASGLTREQAEREMAQRFGNLSVVRHQLEEIDTGTYRRHELGEWRSVLARDFGQALRGLVLRPAFAAVVVLTLGLGIGATTAIFALLDAVVLRPLPYLNAARLVYIEHPVPGVETNAKWRMSQAGYFFFRKNSRALEDIALYNKTEASLVTPDAAERVRAAAVSGNFFEVVGARPLLGRSFTDADNRPNAAPVAMLGHAFWRQRFNGDSRVVGTSVSLGSTPVTIIGVAPPKLDLPDYQAQVWLPLELDPDAPAVNSHYLDAIGRLRPGVTVGAAQADAARLTSRLPEEFPVAYSPGFMRESRFGVLVSPLRDIVIGGMSRTLWILLGAVSIVMLIAVANVANLFLVRAEARRRETDIRLVLGAGRLHLASHDIAESILLSLLGGLLAVGLAYGAIRFLVVINPSSVPRLAELSLGWQAGVVALVLSLGAGVGLGLLPLTRLALGGGSVSTLREGGRTQTASRGQLSARSALVVAQMALAVVLLAAAGLMVRSFQRLRSVQPGFDASNVLTFEVSLPYTRYVPRVRGPAAYVPVFRYHRDLAQQLAALPGVTSVGMTQALAMKDGDGCALVFVKDRGYTRENAPCVGNIIAGPGYFTTLGIPVRGRVPTWADVDEQSGAVVVSKALADHMWPGEDPIGKELRPNGPVAPWYHVVGVTGDVLTRGLDQPPSEIVYYPMVPIEGAPLWYPPTHMTVVIRTRATDPLSVAPAARRVVTALDREVPVANVQTMQTIVERSTARTTFAMLLLAVAGGMALVLSAVGIYGVISYTVTQRRPEIGVRMALGAQAAQVGRMVVAQSLRFAAAGIAIGLLGAFATTRVLQSLLFGVNPTDPVTLGGVTIILVMLGALAAYVPARRATKVDPVEVLRQQG
ncbi:MAG TPA: ABC transporter permease [Gemmatimonadaceae bacterium]|nr:ABC transporter permease [Gemmatimonadaceae bacterium]